MHTFSEKDSTKGNLLTGGVSIGSLTLESGVVLENVELAFEKFGAENGPFVLVCHALTGNQFAVGTEEEPGWWSGLIGPGKSIDTNHFQVITFNVLGGCNGSTGPLSINPSTGKMYRSSFPQITVRDMVRAQRRALTKLGIDHLHAVIGGSLGGMQVFEWGVMYPRDMDKLFIFASTPYLSDYGIAYNRIGIEAIIHDPNFRKGNYTKSTDVKGLEIARMIGMVTYRSAAMFASRFSRKQMKPHTESSIYEVESYLQYQGKKLTQRFDVNSYLILLYAMNHHDIGRGRGGVESVLKQIKAEVIAISFEHDLIYPASLMKEFVNLIPNHHYYHVPTEYGHDGFLVEFEKWGPYVKEHMENIKIAK
jgi:homoserine O-acetyltransferase/O-succinyltransferase